MGIHTLAALAVISNIISLPSSSVCGLKMTWVASRGGDVLNGRWRGGYGVFVESGVRRAVVGKRLGLVVFVEHVLVLAVYSRAGTRRSRIGAAAWRRMLSWMKREAVEGGLMQGRGGIAMGGRGRGRLYRGGGLSLWVDGCDKSPLWWDKTGCKISA